MHSIQAIRVAADFINDVCQQLPPPDGMTQQTIHGS
jgi:hypothetical protein